MIISPQLRSLLAKEWAERRAILAFGVVLAALYVGYGIAYEVEYRTRALIAGYYATCMPLSCLAVVLLAMPTAAGEYSQRTIKFSASLPVSLRQMAWVRLVGAWACLTIPIVLGALGVTALLASGCIEQAELRVQPSETRLPDRASLPPSAAIGFLWTTIMIAVASTMELMALLSFIGTRCRTERQVGFWGAVVFLIWTVLTSVPQIVNIPSVASGLGIVCPQSLATNWGYKEIDGSSYGDLELGPAIWGPLAGSFILTSLLGYGFARLYGSRSTETGKPSDTRHWRWPMPRLLSFGRFLWPGPLGALVWLNLRQSLPLCAAGLTLAVLITVCGQFEKHAEAGPFVLQLAGDLPSSSWFVGILWSALVGVGIFASELEPGLQQFWRTRPISPVTWFWTKFSVGLLAVLIVLDGIPAVIGWKSPYHPDSGRMGFSYLACIPLIHAQVYAVAVAAICGLRRPVASAALALLLFSLIDSVLQSLPGQQDLDMLSVFNNMEALERHDGTFSLLSHGYPFVYGVVIAVTLCATVTAYWIAVHPRPESN